MINIKTSVTERPLNLLVIVVVILLYLTNKIYIISHTDGILNGFFRCYFNDLLAGTFISAYTNLLLNTRHTSLIKLSHNLFLCCAAGLIWEYFAPFIKRNAVSDTTDIVFYMVGGTAYWCLLHLSSRTAKTYEHYEKDDPS